MRIILEHDKFKEYVLNNIKERTGKNLQEATKTDLYTAISEAVMAQITDAWSDTKQKIISRHVKQTFYFSAEFLIGRAFGNNIINFGLEHEIHELLKDLDIDINILEDQEADPGLGNGGLGRLAACFLDSMATLSYPGHGYGIRYKYGMFEQQIVNGYQIEKPDNWLNNPDPWEVRRECDSVQVKFGGHVDNVIEASGRVGFRRNNAETIIAVPYDIPVIGFRNGHINTLRLWQAQSLEPFNLEKFNDGDYEGATAGQNAAENISRVLYPNDNSPQGKELRLRQQYFFTSASLQDIIKKYEKTYGADAWKEFPEKTSIQLNDTHPVVAIPELMRLLIDWKHLDWDDAWNICTKTFAYTNHTVLAEALESWDIHLFKSTLPRIYQIIEEINRRFLEDLKHNPQLDMNSIHNLAILDNGRIKMANLAIIGSYKINGVAALHTEILKNDVLKEWFQLYPEKFLNKTNGITPRRWLVYANPRLTALIDKKIGTNWKTHLSELEKLLKFESDSKFLDELYDIKLENKKELASYIEKWTGIQVSPHAIFDVQIKRFHEYKRQLLNILHIISLYLRIKENPNLDIPERVFIFGGKAASGYRQAKLIIKLINNAASVINNDPVAGAKIKVVFIPNYRVSVAEKIFPGSDISEQISTAGKEASGTGNMKFMANGAITLGTLDGANIEIAEEAGIKNCIIFGSSAEELTNLDSTHQYDPYFYYNNNTFLKNTLDSLVNGTFTMGEDINLFRDIFNSLLYGHNGNRADVYYVLKDFDSYTKAQQKSNELYRNKNLWSLMMLYNIAKCGKFSSDRTIKEYAEEIWNIEPMKK
ncbi:MAG: glycogen/starch/alpha-glucan phosphorylase [Brevinemataceae bacterium]